MMLEKRFEASKGRSCVGKNVPAKSKCKGPEARTCLALEEQQGSKETNVARTELARGKRKKDGVREVTRTGSRTS